jgi:hypothetical protein
MIINFMVCLQNVFSASLWNIRQKDRNVNDLMISKKTAPQSRPSFIIFCILYFYFINTILPEAVNSPAVSW